MMMNCCFHEPEEEEPAPEPDYDDKEQEPQPEPQLETLGLDSGERSTIGMNVKWCVISDLIKNTQEEYMTVISLH